MIVFVTLVSLIVCHVICELLLSPVMFEFLLIFYKLIGLLCLLFYVWFSKLLGFFDWDVLEVVCKPRIGNRK